MKTTKLVYLVGSLCALSLVALQGCGDDAEEADGGSGGSTAGSSSGGKGGSTSGGSTSGGSSSGGSTSGGSSNGGSTSGGSSNGGSSNGGTDSSGGDTGTAGDTGAGGAGASEKAAVCEEYCEVYFARNCDDETKNTDDTYADVDGCETQCLTLQQLGSEGDSAGNTIHCRLSHAGFAPEGGDGSDDHCGHAAFDSTGPCD